MIERVVTRDSVCQAIKPILISRADALTDQTLEAVGDHNNVLWCKCPDMRPPGFEAAAICKET